MASGSLDGSVRLWDLTTGTARAVLRGHADGVASVAFSPDGRTLASAGGEAKLWQTATGRELNSLAPRGDRVWSIAWARRGHRLVGGCGSGAIKIWDAGE